MTSAVLDRIGLGLWTMRSMALGPRNRIADYRAFCDDARLAERLGFRSIWTAEHRIWYDGWCPAPLHALAMVAGVTTRLRLGTAVLLASQHDPLWLARSAAVLDRVSHGRLDLGIGLGHRDVEFDTFGLRRDRRGRRMDEALEVMPAVWAGEYGDEPAGPQIWMGEWRRARSSGRPSGQQRTAAPDAAARRHPALSRHVARPRWLERDRRHDARPVDRARPGSGARRRAPRSNAGFTEEAGWWVLKVSRPSRCPRRSSAR